MRKMLLAALGTAGVLLTVVVPAASASPTPPGISPAAGTSPAAMSAGSCGPPYVAGCQFENYEWQNSRWAYSVPNNNWYTSTVNRRTVVVAGANDYQQLHDWSRAGQCLTLVWPANIIADHTCGTATTQEWRLTQINPMLNEWVIDNLWLGQNHYNLCPGPYAAVITANGPDATLVMDCDQAGTGAPAANQIWLAITV